jgi:hypothetical protein
MNQQGFNFIGNMFTIVEHPIDIRQQLSAVIADSSQLKLITFGRLKTITNEPHRTH